MDGQRSKNGRSTGTGCCQRTRTLDSREASSTLTSTASGTVLHTDLARSTRKQVLTSFQRADTPTDRILARWPKLCLSRSDWTFKTGFDRRSSELEMIRDAQRNKMVQMDLTTGRPQLFDVAVTTWSLSLVFQQRDFKNHTLEKEEGVTQRGVRVLLKGRPRGTPESVPSTSFLVTRS